MAVAAADRLVAAIEGAEGEDVSALLEHLVSVGDLIRTGDGHLRSQVPTRAVDPASWRAPHALATGQVFVKRLADGVDRRVLRETFAALDRCPDLRALPHRLVSDFVVTPFMPDAADLRPRCASAAEIDAQRVHRACMHSLYLFAAHDGALRASAEDLSRARFPIARRHSAALDRLGVLFGADLANEIADVWSSPSCTGPWTLFCDPKPANFILPASARADGVETARRIDLDLLGEEAPLSLQVVLAYFSFPIAFEVRSSPSNRFAIQRRRAVEASHCLGVAEAEIDSVLGYHLLRNFVSAADAGQSAKALQMAAVLVQATLHAGAARTAARLSAAVAAWRRASSAPNR